MSSGTFADACAGMPDVAPKSASQPPLVAVGTVTRAAVSPALNAAINSRFLAESMRLTTSSFPDA